MDYFPSVSFPWKITVIVCQGLLVFACYASLYAWSAFPPYIYKKHDVQFCTPNPLSYRMLCVLGAGNNVTRPMRVVPFHIGIGALIIETKYRAKLCKYLCRKHNVIQHLFTREHCARYARANNPFFRTKLGSFSHTNFASLSRFFKINILFFSFCILQTPSILQTLYCDILWWKYQYSR